MTDKIIPEQWRTFARMQAEGSAAQLVAAVKGARAGGMSEETIEAELVKHQEGFREAHAPVFTSAMIELMVTEMMDAYRKQMNPPSRSLQ